MPKKVIKRDGSEEEFIKEKLVVSGTKTGAPLSLAREMANEISNEVDKEKVKTEELKKIYLEKLKKGDPEWRENWITYDRRVKHKE